MLTFTSMRSKPRGRATPGGATHPDHFEHLKKEKRGRVAVRAFSLFRRDPHATGRPPCNATPACNSRRCLLFLFWVGSELTPWLVTCLTALGGPLRTCAGVGKGMFCPR